MLNRHFECSLFELSDGANFVSRGYTYAKNEEAPSGCLAFGSGFLAHRAKSFDGSDRLVTLFHKDTLEQEETLLEPPEFRVDGPTATIDLVSNGTDFFWIRSFQVPEEKRQAANAAFVVFVDKFSISAEGRGRGVIVAGERRYLEKLEDTEQSRSDLLEKVVSNCAILPVNMEGGGGRPGPAPIDPNSTPMRVSHRLVSSCAAFWACGNSLTMLTTVSAGSQTASASGSAAVSRAVFGNSGGGGAAKAVAANWSFDLRTAQFAGRSEVTEASTCNLNKGAALSGMGAAYDPWNNAIWTAGGDWTDEYRCPGLPDVSHIKKRLGITSATPPHRHRRRTKSVAGVQEILRSLVLHVGIQSQYCATSARLRERVAAEERALLPLGTDLFCSFVGRGQVPEALCMLSLLGVLLHHGNRAAAAPDNKGGEGATPSCARLRGQLGKLLSETKDKAAEEEEGEEDKLRMMAEVLECIRVREGGVTTAQAIGDLLKRGAGCTAERYLLEDMVQREINDLRNLVGLTAVAERLGDLSFVKSVLDRMAERDVAAMDEIVVIGQRSCKVLLSQLPRLTVLQKYALAVVFKLGHALTQMGKDSAALARAKAPFAEVARHVIAKSISLVQKFSATVERVADGFDGEEAEVRLVGVERLAKGTMLGTVLPCVLTCMTHENALDIGARSDGGMTDLVQLLVDSRRAAHGLKAALESVRASDRDECEDRSGTEAAEGGHNGGSEEEEEEGEGVVGEKTPLQIERCEPGFMSGLPHPPTVESGRVVETPHPMRDNYKLRETVTLPGATHLYLAFDRRCSTQYDYDKLCVHAGKTATVANKAAEFGGNTYGYGSKTVLGGGWPKECLKIEGDSVTLSFEVRSGREQNVPDRVLWGFRVQVRPLETPEIPRHFPFFANLSVILSSLCCRTLALAYDGSNVTDEELECKTLLESPLLQRCVWKQLPAQNNEQENEDLDTDTDVARIKLPAETLKRLREMAQIKPLPIRASVRDVLKADRIEEGIISSVIKHLAFSDAVASLGQAESAASAELLLLADVMAESYQKLHALIRRLQVLADLESQWTNEVDDVRANLVRLEEVFFHDYQHHESKAKELALLCFLKGVAIEKENLQRATNDLQIVMEVEARKGGRSGDEKHLPITDKIVGGIIERIELLLRVNIITALEAKSDRSCGVMSRSLQGWPVDHLRCRGRQQQMTRRQSAEMERSLDDSILQIPRLKRSIRKIKSAKSTIDDLSSAATSHATKEAEAAAPESVVLEQLFSFIGSHPEKAISAASFLRSVSQRRRRSRGRIQALALMRQLLLTTDAVGGSGLILSPICQILQRGPRTEELTCGSLVTQVRQVFADTMTELVKIANRYPLASKSAICQMCTVPYSRREESCLVHSGLVRLLDKLCKLHDISADDVELENQSASQKLSQTAWLAFKVLANRCVEWEESGGEEDHDDGGGGRGATPARSSLAQQVSVLLTNHLIQASQSNERPINCAALQEVLTLFSSLAKSKLGKEILSQSVCVSKLLSLLLEPRLSPKMIMTIACLCHVALPLMSENSCRHVTLPAWKIGTHTSNDDGAGEENGTGGSNTEKIVSLLVAKIADFSVPGCQASHAASSKSTVNTNTGPAFSASGDAGALQRMQESLSNSTSLAAASLEQVPDTNMSLFVHKRAEQNAQDVIQQLLAVNHEVRLFRQVGSSENMERVVKLDKSLQKTNVGEVACEDATMVFRKAIKLAQHGFVVSLGPAQRPDEMSEQRRLMAEQMCKEKNKILAQYDPQRPFISSQVANGMAAELISLLQSLLRSESAADIWKSAIFDVMTASLKKFHSYVKLGDRLFTASKPELCDIFTTGRNILACFAILGGFAESLKPGMRARIAGAGMAEQAGTVLATDPYTQMAQVNFSEECRGEAEVWSLPLNRLSVENSLESSAVALFLPLASEIVEALQGLLIPDAKGIDHLSEGLPASGDGSGLRLRTSRLFAEVRTSACKLLSIYLREPLFACRFLQKSCYAVDMLKCLSKDCLPSDRRGAVALNCERLRSVYRDCEKPPPPHCAVGGKEKERHNVWNAASAFPPLQSLVLTHGLLGLTYYAEPAMATGLPRGILMYAERPMSIKEAPYFEVNILSFGSNNDDSSSPLLSVGMAPLAERSEGSWTNPVGTVLFHNNGMCEVMRYNHTPAQGIDELSLPEVILVLPKDRRPIGRGRLRSLSPRDRV